MPNALLFLQTGGTIDKDYPQGEADHGYAFKIGAPGFAAVLARAKRPPPWRTATVLQKDSLDITDADRAAIRQAVLDAPETRIVITHGTDTMRQTAAALADVPAKTIVLTGAMLPEKFRDSDADFNLGMAVAAADWLPAGVYIALDGEVTAWDVFDII